MTVNKTKKGNTKSNKSIGQLEMKRAWKHKPMIVHRLVSTSLRQTTTDLGVIKCYNFKLLLFFDTKFP